MTYLVQPDSDILHMNKLPIVKQRSLLIKAAYTLGSDISSGEILYQDLQQIYAGFEECEQSGSLSSSTYSKKVGKN